MLSAALILITLGTLGEHLIATFTDVTTSWGGFQERADVRADSRMAGPVGLSIAATSTVEMTLVNDGDAPIAQFSDWDVLFEVKKSPGLAIAYLTYTTSTSPGSNQWSVKGIYLNAASSTPETVDPGVFNPGEEMIVVANPSPSVKEDTHDRATFVTPDGTTAKVIFKVVQ